MGEATVYYSNRKDLNIFMTQVENTCANRIERDGVSKCYKKNWRRFLICANSLSIAVITSTASDFPGTSQSGHL